MTSMTDEPRSPEEKWSIAEMIAANDRAGGDDEDRGFQREYLPERIRTHLERRSNNGTNKVFLPDDDLPF